MLAEFVGSLSGNVGALGAGALVGIVFALLRLPVPAPRVLPGILGIVGLWAGYVAGSLLLAAWKGRGH